MLSPCRLNAATNDLSGLLQKGLFEEEANRNLDAAVRAYQALVTAFDQDRKLAATAVFRLGECYRKLGKTNEAVLQYERIVREFADETTLTTLSRQNLAGFKPATPAVEPSSFQERLNGILAMASAGDTEFAKRLQSIVEAERTKASPVPSLPQSVRQEQKRLLEQEIRLLEQDAVEAKRRFEMGAGPQADVRNKEREILQLQRQLAALDVAPAQAASSPAFTERLQTIIRRADAEVAPNDEDTEIRRLQAMIQNSPDLINDASGGMTPLCQAAERGQLRVAVFLLDHGAEIDRKAGNKTPLHHAVARGQKAMAELLLQRGADVNARDGSGGTALHAAAQDGFLSVAEVLVQHKADLNAQNSQRNGEQTPLLLAVYKGHMAMAELLIAQGAEVDAGNVGGFTPLMQAAGFGNAKLVAKLLAVGAKPDLLDKQGRTALSYTAERGNLDCVKALLAAKADPNAGKGTPPIHAAIHGNSLKVLEALLEAGADVNRSASVGYEIRTSRATFKNGGMSVTPIFLALAERNADAAKLLLKHQADPNGKSPDGMPLVAYACISNQPDMLKLLLDAGANPDAVCDEGGYTAVHHAIGNRNVPLARLLLEHKANPNLRSQDGRTPLDIAMKLSEPSRVPQPPQPVTPWTVASPASPEEMQALLRQHGAMEGSPIPEATKSLEKP